MNQNKRRYPICALSLLIVLGLLLAACRPGRSGEQQEGSLRVRRSQTTTTKSTQSAKDRIINPRQSTQAKRRAPSRNIIPTQPVTSRTTIKEEPEEEETSRVEENDDFQAVVQYYLDGASAPSGQPRAFDDVPITEGRIERGTGRVYFDYTLASAEPVKEGYTFDHWAYQIVIGDEIIESGDAEDEPGESLSRFVSLAQARLGRVRLISAAVFNKTEAPETKPTETKLQVITDPERFAVTLRYDLQGGFVHEADEESFYDQKILPEYVDEEGYARYRFNLADVVPEKSGHAFDHWTLTEELYDKAHTYDWTFAKGEAVKLSFGQDYVDQPVILIFKAQWKQDATEPIETEPEVTDAPTTEPTEPSQKTYHATLLYNLNEGEAAEGEAAAFEDRLIESEHADDETVDFSVDVGFYVPRLEGHEFDHWAYQIYNGYQLLNEGDEHAKLGESFTISVDPSLITDDFKIVLVARYHETEVTNVSEPEATEPEVTESEETQPEETEPNTEEPEEPDDPAKKQQDLLHEAAGQEEGFISSEEMNEGKDQVSFFVPSESDHYKSEIFFSNGEETIALLRSLGEIHEVKMIEVDQGKLLIANGVDADHHKVAYVAAISQGQPVLYQFDQSEVIEAEDHGHKVLRVKNESAGDYGTGEVKPLFYDYYWMNEVLQQAFGTEVTPEEMHAKSKAVSELENTLVQDGATELTYLKYSNERYALNYKVDTQDYALLFTIEADGHLEFYSHQLNEENDPALAISYGHYEKNPEPKRAY